MADEQNRSDALPQTPPQAATSTQQTGPADAGKGKDRPKDDSSEAPESGDRKATG